MRFGEIISKAWKITWRYRALWVLGLFAGVTGGGGGGGGGNYGNNFGSRTGTGSGSGNPFGSAELSRLGSQLTHWLPLIVVGIAGLLVVGLVFAVLGIGARGALVWAVNEIEEGRRPALGESWNRGFARFWSLLGLGLLLGLPILVAVLLLVAAILIPLAGPLMRGGEPSLPAVIAPMCGALAIGIPLLLVAGVVLGIMQITGTRFIILDGMGAVHAAGEGWRAFRARIGDHILMFLINIGLNIAAGLAIAIPFVILALVTIVPAVIAGASGRWTTFGLAIAVFFLFVFAVSFIYRAIWGTFTSALWTIFYRRLTGRELLAPAWPPAPTSPVPGPPVWAPPVAPVVPGPPAGMPPAPPAPPVMPGPPVEAPTAPPMAPTPPMAPALQTPSQPPAQPPA